MHSASAYGKSDDTRIAVLAAKQHGVISTFQLRALGYPDHAIHTRAQSGRLHRVHRGVYAVGHTKLSLHGRWMAAVLACGGPGAESVLSHRAAAALHELRPAPRGPIDVTATSRHCIDGIRCHHTRTLDAADSTTGDSIPVTTVSRTVLDLAEIELPQRLRSTIEAAQRAGVWPVDELEALISRSPGRHGLKPLRHALAQLHDDAPFTRSELENRFLELIRAHGLPEPRCNVLVAGLLVDFHWPEPNLVVEVDGYRFHRTRAAFETDRRRDARLLLAGVPVVRFTYRRVVHDAGRVAGELRRLLSDANGRRRERSDR